MNIIKLTSVLFVLIFSLCTKVDDKIFKRYYLKSNKISKSRNDFFAIKNYGKNNEQYKIKIDTLVVDYLKRDRFLITNYMNISKQDTIKILAKLIKIVGGSKIQIAQYKILDPLESINVIENDTINVSYSILYEPKEFSEKSILTLVKYNGIEIMKNHYIFPDYNAQKWMKPIKN